MLRCSSAQTHPQVHVHTHTHIHAHAHARAHTDVCMHTHSLVSSPVSRALLSLSLLSRLDVSSCFLIVVVVVAIAVVVVVVAVSTYFSSLLQFHCETYV